ncbi:YybS family protein [Bacillus xiapuensis]|uniref:YybS family protein n=1 Tax=Bacillus xiapuensis TaxID=2014075 RepID=UPI000C237C6B|nr:YybS family protein [Bacillus xiapuensis]
MDKKTIVKEGVLLLGIFVLLLVATLYLPVLSVITSLFLILPFFVFSAKYSIQASLIFGAASVLAAALAGGAGAVPLAFSFGITGLVIGTMIQKKQDKFSIFMAGGLIFLLNMVILYVMVIKLAGVNIAKEMDQAFRNSFQESVKMMDSVGQPLSDDSIKQMQEGFDFLYALMPSFFVLLAFGAVFLFITVHFPILKKLKINVPHFQPFREWKMPKSILWYYLALLLASFAAAPEKGTLWYSAHVNLMFMLQFCLVIHGLSFLFFFAYRKNWPKVLPILFTVFSFLFLPLLYLVRLLGIIDLGFNLRQHLQQKSK